MDTSQSRQFRVRLSGPFQQIAGGAKGGDCKFRPQNMWGRVWNVGLVFFHVICLGLYVCVCVCVGVCVCVCVCVCVLVNPFS